MITTRTKTTKTTYIDLTREQVADALRLAGFNLPDNADIFVRVPGGGDWSNTDLMIDDEITLQVTYTTTEETNT